MQYFCLSFLYLLLIPPNVYVFLPAFLRPSITNNIWSSRVWTVAWLCSEPLSVCQWDPAGSQRMDHFQLTNGGFGSGLRNGGSLDHRQTVTIAPHSVMSSTQKNERLWCDVRCFWQPCWRNWQHLKANNMEQRWCYSFSFFVFVYLLVGKLTKKSLQVFKFVLSSRVLPYLH